MRVRWTAVAATLTALIATGGRPAPGPLAGQAPARLFPDRDLIPELLAGPRDPVVAGRLLYADPDPTAYGPGVAGEVALAATVPVLLLAGGSTRDALVIGLEAGVFARFSFQVVERELVHTDWVFAVPLVWRRGDHWLRLRYYHASSHLGDEYQRRFGPASLNFSRDGADLTVHVRPAAPAARDLGLGIYAGALWSPNAHPEEATVWRGRAGIELDPYDGAAWRPYGALDMELEEAGLHRPRWTARAGIGLPAARTRPLRLALELTSGPSAMGQFSDRETRSIALGLFWNP